MRFDGLKEMFSRRRMREREKKIYIAGLFAIRRSLTVNLFFEKWRSKCAEKSHQNKIKKFPPTLI